MDKLRTGQTEEAIQIEDRWYVLATSSRADDRIRVLKNEDLFAVFDRFGDFHHIGTGEQGIYSQGTRYLSLLELRVDGRRPLLLNSSVRQDNSLLAVDLTTPDLPSADGPAVLKGTVHIFRAKLLWDRQCHEHLRLVNYGTRPVSLIVSLQFSADYADIFEVRGFKRGRRGVGLATIVSGNRVILGYRGLDDVIRRTVLSCSPAPLNITAERIEYQIALSPGQQANLYLNIDCKGTDETSPQEFDQIPALAVGARYANAFSAAEEAKGAALSRTCRMVTSNEQFNEWIDRSSADLLMLTTNMSSGPYPYAGVPWYSTPFGRDGIITALECLWLDPSIAKGVLTFLSNTQATETSPQGDAEPGKILHETREGELAALGEIPFGRYYGSIDSTPLFIVLAGAYYGRTGDLTFINTIWPNVEKALGWIDQYGDLDGDGFVEYRRKSDNGLVNQGWKDSEDAIFHRDGTLARGAIALAEVQGYVYLAMLNAAILAHAVGDDGRASALRLKAARLRANFERTFWCEEIGTFSMALDGEKRPCAVHSSNAGQVLWSGIASAEHARRVADQLMGPAYFSGWGIRTIAEGEARYNPMSYHNGSIWPHDNAMVAMGLANYDMKSKAVEVLDAMFEASNVMDLHRLPELYCGFVRRAGEGPTLYPVACSPQAWASASVFFLVQACLGLTFDCPNRTVRFDHPLLPSYLQRVQISELRLGDASIDLALERHEHDVGVTVLGKRGDIKVAVLL